LSQEIAEALITWLESIFGNNIEVFFSPKIDPGTRANNIIWWQLENAEDGLLILTADNIGAPWLMFEAGAISKKVGQSMVTPILFNRKPNEREYPIWDFEYIEFSKEHFLKLINDISSKVNFGNAESAFNYS
jgi:hypothetical protein